MNDFTDFSDRLLLLVIKQVESYIPGKYNVPNFLFFDAVDVIVLVATIYNVTVRNVSSLMGLWCHVHSPQ